MARIRLSFEEVKHIVFTKLGVESKLERDNSGALRCTSENQLFIEFAKEGSHDSGLEKSTE